jgi:tyrosyl-tRNA synthetase
VGVDEDPGQMFGKTMSVSDDLMDRWHTLLLGQERNEKLHPMEAKKQLAFSIVARYHGEEKANEARADFESKFVKNDTEAVWPEVEIGDERRLIASVSKAFLEGYNLKRSGGEIRQLITQGAVQLDGEKFDDVKENLPQDVNGRLLRLDKKRSVRLL